MGPGPKVRIYTKSIENVAPSKCQILKALYNARQGKSISTREVFQGRVYKLIDMQKTLTEIDKLREDWSSHEIVNGHLHKIFGILSLGELRTLLQYIKRISFSIKSVNYNGILTYNNFLVKLNEIFRTVETRMRNEKEGSQIVDPLFKLMRSITEDLKIK